MIGMLALQTAIEPDTVVTVPARDTYDLIQAFAAGSVAATFAAFFALLAFAFYQVHRVTKAIEEAGKKIPLDPAVASLRRTAKHVESISGAVDEEVVKLTESVSRLSDRLTQASDRMEERIEEFNALMEVVQSEAEGAFVDGAAAARGVRAGLENLGGRGRRDPVSGAHRSAPGHVARAALPGDPHASGPDEPTDPRPPHTTDGAASEGD